LPPAALTRTPAAPNVRSIALCAWARLAGTVASVAKNAQIRPHHGCGPRKPRRDPQNGPGWRRALPHRQVLLPTPAKDAGAPITTAISPVRSKRRLIQAKLATDGRPGDLDSERRGGDSWVHGLGSLGASIDRCQAKPRIEEGVPQASPDIHPEKP